MLWWIYLACNLSFEDKNNPNGLLLSIFRWNKERMWIKLETLWWDKTTHNRWWLYFFLPLYNEESVNSLHINRAMVKSQSIQKNHIGQIRFKQEKERERERKEQKCSINRTLIYIIFKKRKEKKCQWWEKRQQLIVKAPSMRMDYLSAGKKESQKSKP